MLSIVLRFLSAIFLVWIFRRLFLLFLGGSRASQPSDSSSGNSNHMVKDPVCGMYMDSRLAIKLERKQEQIFFCSDDCRQKYLNQSAGVSNTPPPG